jgi:hypothetical protein
MADNMDHIAIPVSLNSKELVGALYDKTLLGSGGGIWYLNALMI